MIERSETAGGNQSVARALSILNLLAVRGEPVGVREIARQLDLAPSIAQRLVKTLARSGFLEQTGTTLRYAIGYRAFQVGNSFVAQSNLHTAVIPELYALADEHINAFLGVMRDAAVVYLATVQSNGPVAINHRPGAQTHLHSTAMGKALLAEMPEEQVRALLTKSPLPRLTPRTKTAVSQLMLELETVRRQGYSVSEEENRLGFFSIGAIVRDAFGVAVAVISGAVPTAGLRNQDKVRITRRVMQAAENASRRLGAPQVTRAAKVGRNPRGLSVPQRLAAESRMRVPFRR